ncbi:hypothetical protein OESDEN_18947 [Oesophagostomum dentatum]|uniref:Uncharacterized protein n=1 Tax=Oesophagostomum dentatum TaxID=61180 RepID=A0A0B1SCU1_OESDE|nr:hypothetical protein OESDEN_18947 [Oesophagostomum dentatum]
MRQVNLQLQASAKSRCQVPGDVVFGVDGGVLYNGAVAENVENSLPLNISVLHEKMVGILLSDSVANSLFSHLFSNGMGNVYYR